MEEIDELKTGDKLYSTLDAKRTKRFDELSMDRQDSVTNACKEHKAASEFLTALRKLTRRDSSKKCGGLTSKVNSYLFAVNKFGLEPERKPCRLVLIGDATASMNGPWDAAKRYVSTMLDRIHEFAGGASIMLKWIAFRDYSDRSIVESSEWTDQPSEIQGFIANVSITGGADWPEAVEMGLKSVADDPEPATHAILIGDAPPHTEGKGNPVPGQHGHILETGESQRHFVISEQQR